MAQAVWQLGEKRLLREIILPLVNPQADRYLSGDDCGVVKLPDGQLLCASTDRVPYDLTAYRLKLMSEFDLGFYLAVLNISDIAAMGASPMAMLLNLAMPSDFPVADLEQVVSGVLAAAGQYACPLVGGDLSDAVEPSFCATSIGLASPGACLLRRGAEIGDAIYMSGPCGVAATAFRYYRDARPAGMRLPDQPEVLLREALVRPIPKLDIAQALARSPYRATAMDNTDGLSQSIDELAGANDAHYSIDAESLPIDPITRVVATFLDEDPFDLAMGPGADFNLIGTVDPSAAIDKLGLYRIGTVLAGSGISMSIAGHRRTLKPNGWNYFTGEGGHE